MEAFCQGPLNAAKWSFKTPAANANGKIKREYLTAQSEVLGLKKLCSYKIVQADSQSREPFGFRKNLIFQIKCLILI